ncbi:UNVERIFIED_CONTAM: hypothetical protein FKN15_047415 [Acipenser sinensis]
MQVIREVQNVLLICYHSLHNIFLRQQDPFLDVVEHNHSSNHGTCSLKSLCTSVLQCPRCLESYTPRRLEEEQDVLSLAASWDEESFLQTETQDPDLTQRARGIPTGGSDAPLPCLGMGKGEAMASGSYHGRPDYPDPYGTMG